MHYQFQAASNVSDYLKAIAGSNEFVAKYDVQTGIIVLNYIFTTPTSFPDPSGLTGEDHRLAVLRRDCRGLKFDISTGEVVAKPYHKFFNCNQVPETQIGVIDWSRPHVILEKLDGSMITPFRGSDRRFQWHTKMGPTQVAGPVYKAASDAHLALCEAMLEDGRTPIFEWCSRIQRIVVDYPVDRLILTAIRHNVTGEYLAYPQLAELAGRFDVPVVRALPGSVTNIQEFLNETGGIEGAEGFVIRFDDGHMCKVKGAWYCRIHNTKEILVFEKNVWNLVLQNSVDDAKPFMDDKDRSVVDDFAAELEQRVHIKAREMAAFVESCRHVGSKKCFAMECVPQIDRRMRAIAFRIWDGHDPVMEIRNFLAQNVGTQRAVDEVRDIIGGLRWNDFYYSTAIDD